jgi:hypothetical protein
MVCGWFGKKNYLQELKMSGCEEMLVWEREAEYMRPSSRVPRSWAPLPSHPVQTPGGPLAPKEK